MEILYDYQLDAVRNIHKGCILCGGVGSGKTRTALAWYYIQCGGDLDNISGNIKDIPLYVITTAKKRDSGDWVEEAGMFYIKNIVVDSWQNIVKYSEVKDSIIIFDEQRLVGSGVWVNTFLKISKKNTWILLSATPADTWMDYIPVFVANGFYRNRTDFINSHVIYDRFAKYPKVNRFINTKTLEKIRDFILVPMDYHKPTKRINVPILCNYDKEKYKKIIRTRADLVTKEPFMNAAALCMALRKVVNSDPSRSEEVIKILDKSKRAIIFYNYDFELFILREIKYPKGTLIREWNGHAHDTIPSTERWVYLVQYTAGAEGWNCTETDTIIFWSATYSYKIHEQTSGRIDRVNTPFERLYYYSLKSKAPIDLAIEKALSEKRAFNYSAFVNKLGGLK